MLRASLFLLLLFSALAQAQQDIVVIVNKTNPTDALSHKAVVDMFMGKYLAFPDGSMAQTYDYQKDSQIRSTFLSAITGRSINQINAYWSRVRFSGKVSPPQIFPDVMTVLDKVAHTANAVAYVPAHTVTAQVKVVYTIAQ
ncbi:hypothetical protein CWB96_08220 [Pseudoalteromonas citrea]|uniref:Phosphate ABC transporter substrate-binding protein n=1 Tax=Pseudoalteromonas citrea TaxID=43655 RepID=A0A5S3XQL1_9GAMM|nr:hypothetical protein [Pseudoalteromonas citrea]TMP45027.1 hypothetical protein CWB97_04250 [Pseudoalteromonas citrea]TMP59851.1 hypothetical protein CWB96_08220 [Pseudoalteromonas citrea]